MLSKKQIKASVLRRMYLEKGMSVADIAGHFGVSVYTIRGRFRKHGITGRSRKVVIPKKILVQKFVKQRKSVPAIAAELGHATRTVYARLREHGIAIGGPRIEMPAKFLKQEYLVKKRTMQQIADDLGCSRSLVLLNIHRAGIPVRRSNSPRQLRIPKAELAKLYRGRRMTTTEIGRMTGFTAPTVNRLLQKYGIARRPRGSIPRKIVSKGVLRRMYLDRQMSIAEVARRLDCTLDTVRWALKKHGIKRRHKSMEGILTEDLLRRMYVKEGLVARQIAERHNCTVGVIYKYMRRFGIPGRRG